MTLDILLGWDTSESNVLDWCVGGGGGSVLDYGWWVSTGGVELLFLKVAGFFKVLDEDMARNL